MADGMPRYSAWSELVSDQSEHRMLCHIGGGSQCRVWHCCGTDGIWRQRERSTHLATRWPFCPCQSCSEDTQRWATPLPSVVLLRPALSPSTLHSFSSASRLLLDLSLCLLSSSTASPFLPCASMSMRLFDVIIVGGGPAGLSAALGLVRAHRSVLLIDSKQYRNSGAPAMQNVITMDGMAPSAFREKARSDLSRYPTFSSIDGFVSRVTQRDEAAMQHQHPLHKLQLDVQVKQNAAVQVTADGDTSAVTPPVDSFLTRRLLLATGVKDILPNIPGFDAAWGDTIHV